MKLLSVFSALLLVGVSASAQLASSHQSTSAPASSKSGMNAQLPKADLVKLQVGDKPVAKVNGVVLTDRDLVREEYAIFPYARQHGGLPKSMAGEIRKGALDMIIFEELVYQDATRRGITVPASKTDAAVSAFKAQFPSAGDFQKYLQLECKGSSQVLRQKIRRSLVIEKVMRLEVNGKAVVTPAEAKAYYEKNQKSFQVPDSFAFQSISLLPPDNATPAQLADMKKRADEIFEKAKATKSYEEFGLLAEKYSEDDFRVNMGDHKNVPTAKLPDDIKKIAASLKPGEISPLLNLGGAYSILRLNSFVPAHQLKYEEVKDQLLPNMQKEKVNRLRTELGKQLRQNAKIELL